MLFSICQDIFIKKLKLSTYQSKNYIKTKKESNNIQINLKKTVVRCLLSIDYFS